MRCSEAGRERKFFPEAFQRHFDSGQYAQQLKLIETPKVADAKEFSFGLSETLPERQIDELERVIDECIGVQSLRHRHSG